MKRLAYTESDGRLAIVVPAPNDRRKNETEQQWLARVASVAIPPGAPFIEIDAAAVPADRTFRNAWTANGAGVQVDMTRAREIHMNRIRVARNGELVKLDLAYMRADEAGDAAAKTTIAQRKQALRDIPTTFDLGAAATPEQLSVMWPQDVPRGEL